MKTSKIEIDETVPTPRILNWFPSIFRRQANYYAAYYGTEVWLVGSALVKDDPRDIDIRLILSDEEMYRFYGRPIPPAEEQKILGETFKRWEWRQLSDQLKRNRKMGNYGGYPIDFQIQSLAEAAAFEKFPRIRLDDAPEFVLRAGLK